MSADWGPMLDALASGPRENGTPGLEVAIDWLLATLQGGIALIVSCLVAGIAWESPFCATSGLFFSSVIIKLVNSLTVSMGIKSSLAC